MTRISCSFLLATLLVCAGAPTWAARTSSDAVLGTCSAPAVICAEVAETTVFGFAGFVGAASVRDDAPRFDIDFRPLLH